MFIFHINTHRPMDERSFLVIVVVVLALALMYTFMWANSTAAAAAAEAAARRYSLCYPIIPGCMPSHLWYNDGMETKFLKFEE